MDKRDDNGNCLPMWRLRGRESVTRDYAAHGHKQTCEVERVP